MSNLPPPPGAPMPPSGAPLPPPPGGWQPSGNPKADAKAAKAYAKASRPWWKKKRFWLAGIVILAIVAAAAGGGSDKDEDKEKVAVSSPSGSSEKSDDGKTTGQQLAESSGSTHDPIDDVTIDSCERDDYLGAKVGLTVLNHSSDPSNYLIEIKIESPDGKTSYDTANATVQGLNNGQTQKETATSLNEIPADAQFVCKIGDVTRFAS